MPINPAFLKLPSLEDAPLEGKRVVVRLDLDLPRSAAGKPQLFRLKHSLPTLNKCLSRASEVTIIGHWGRPEGRVSQFSLRPLADELQRLLNRPITFVENFVKSPNVKSGQSGEKVPNLRLLENLRFWNGETESEPGFAKLLASFGDLYVNESFAAYHASASVTALPHLLPTYFGLQFVNEVQTISKVLQNPKRPIVVVLGGAKADKLEFLPQLLELADQVLLGGLLPTLVKVHDKKLVLGDLDSTSKDLSPVSSELFSQLIMEAGTVIWNGPVGKFEDKSHAAGTRAVAEAMAASTAFTLVGGGDTQAALEELGLEAKIDHLSTGGGALMALLATGTLPAIQAGSGLYS